MHTKLKEHIIKRLGHEPPNLSLVMGHFETVETKRNDHLLQAGEVSPFEL